MGSPRTWKGDSQAHFSNTSQYTIFDSLFPRFETKDNQLICADAKKEEVQICVVIKVMSNELTTVMAKIQPWLWLQKIFGGIFWWWSLTSSSLIAPAASWESQTPQFSFYKKKFTTCYSGDKSNAIIKWFKAILPTPCKRGLESCLKFRFVSFLFIHDVSIKHQSTFCQKLKTWEPKRWFNGLRHLSRKGNAVSTTFSELILTTLYWGRRTEKAVQCLKKFSGGGGAER